MARKRTIDIRHPELTDEMWAKIAPHLPEPVASPNGGPKPVPDRPVVEGILWVPRNGAGGRHCPRGIPPPRPAGVGRGLRRWVVRPGEEGGDGVGKTRKGKGTKWMVVVDGQGIPLASHLDSASPAEVELLGRTPDNIDVIEAEDAGSPPHPERLIPDRGYDSDPLRRRLADRGLVDFPTNDEHSEKSVSST